MKNKRGISPLIASVLLIAFVVTLFLIISSWVQRSVVEPGLQKSQEGFEGALGCLNTNIDIIKYTCDSANKKISLGVDNIGDTDLIKLQVRISNDDQAQPIIVLDSATDGFPLNPLERINKDITYTLADNPNKLEIFPEIESGLCNANVVKKSLQCA